MSRKDNSKYEPHDIIIDITPERLGAKACCGPLHLQTRSIASRTVFCTLQCETCLREASSEVQATVPTAIKQAIERWNSIWPDISHYLDSPSEGVRV